MTANQTGAQSRQDDRWATLKEIVGLIASVLLLAALGVLAMAATP